LCCFLQQAWLFSVRLSLPFVSSLRIH
jgi:hypothetical protein